MNKEKILSTIILAIVLLILGFWAKQGFEAYLKEKVRLKEQQLLNQAVFECGQISKSSWINVSDRSQITEPYKPAYEQCLKDKGY